MSELMKEYDRARLQVLVLGTEAERDKLHLYTGTDRIFAFLLGMISIGPILISIFIFAMWGGGK